MLKLASLFVYATLELIVERPTTRQQRAEWLHRFCNRVLRRMHIAVHVTGNFPSRGALIANHLGYLDVVALAATHPCVFFAKSEIRRWPFLGWITMMAGTLYVERDRGGSAQRARSQIVAITEQDLPLVFFPEGMTSLGETVLKFHTGLLTQSMDAGLPITAARIRYRIADSSVPAAFVAWDDTPLFVHLFRLLALRGIEVELHFADAPIVFTARPNQRKHVAAEARVAVMLLGNRSDDDRLS
jgi:1-acyl-sn-glycerol-3-phosphate acyltransferase